MPPISRGWELRHTFFERRARCRRVAKGASVARRLAAPKGGAQLRGAQAQICSISSTWSSNTAKRLTGDHCVLRAIHPQQGRVGCAHHQAHLDLLLCVTVRSPGKGSQGRNLHDLVGASASESSDILCKPMSLSPPCSSRGDHSGPRRVLPQIRLGINTEVSRYILVLAIRRS